MEKVKCKICGNKGYFDIRTIINHEVNNFILVDIHNKRKNIIDCKNAHICRSCVKEILNSLSREQRNIGDLYKPKRKK